MKLLLFLSTIQWINYVYKNLISFLFVCLLSHEQIASDRIKNKKIKSHGVEKNIYSNMKEKLLIYIIII